MKNRGVVKHNPLILIEHYWPEVNISHIVYNPKLRKCQYQIIRRVTHDGLLLYVQEMVANALVLLVNKQSYFKGNTPKDWSKVKNIRYTIGPVLHTVEYGRVYLPCSMEHKYPGQVDTIKIPINCEIVE